jgi:hypothetical protein
MFGLVFVVIFVASELTEGIEIHREIDNETVIWIKELRRK